MRPIKISPPTEARPIDEGVSLPKDTDEVQDGPSLQEHNGFPLASNAPGPLGLVLETLPPDFASTGTRLFDEARDWYGSQARRFVDALLAHAPGGFTDAVLGELLHRKSCIFRVTGGM